MATNKLEKLLNIELLLYKAGVAENKHVADLGCGLSGHFVFPAAKIVGKEGMIYAVDILKEPLENIKKMARLENLANIKTVWSDLETYRGTKIEPGSIDSALLINTLHQSKHHAHILREAARLLKKRGVLLVAEWKKRALPIGPKIESRVDSDSLIKLAQKAGFHYDEDFKAGEFHYGLIFHKL
jgi:ubiquinone/menaquinone biosynthesis C-methylase UbiE